MQKKCRAQVAVEVLSYAAFFLLIFAIGMAAFFQVQSQEVSRAEYAYATQIAEEFADNIRNAQVAGAGYRQQVMVPATLLGKEYEIRISTSQGGSSAGFVFVSWPGPAGSDQRPSALAPTTATSFRTKPDSTGFVSEANGFITIKPMVGNQVLRSLEINNSAFVESSGQVNSYIYIYATG